MKTTKAPANDLAAAIGRLRCRVPPGFTQDVGFRGGHQAAIRQAVALVGTSITGDSSDLVSRLRLSGSGVLRPPAIDVEAAERIEQLERELAKAKRALARGGFEVKGGEEWKLPLGPAPASADVVTAAADLLACVNTLEIDIDNTTAAALTAFDRTRSRLQKALTAGAPAETPKPCQCLQGQCCRHATLTFTPSQRLPLPVQTSTPRSTSIRSSRSR